MESPTDAENAATLVGTMITCNGLNACFEASIKAEDGSIVCLGDSACGSATKVQATNVSCTGDTSCQNATISFEENAACTNPLACGSATIKGPKDATLTCSDGYACQDARVSAQLSIGPKMMTVCADGDSCNNAIIQTDLTCMTDLSCNGVTMNGVGSLTVICDSEGACNNTYFKEGTLCCGEGCVNANTKADDEGNVPDWICDKEMDDSEDGLSCWQCGKKPILDILTSSVGATIAAILTTLFILGLVIGGLVWFFCKTKGAPVVQDLEDDK